MEEKRFEQLMGEIVAALRSGDMDPHGQIAAYLRTGNPAYITKTGHARDKISGLDREKIREYLSRTAQ